MNGPALPASARRRAGDTGKRKGREAGVFLVKKQANLLKPAWMLRSALSNQEKSVDNFDPSQALPGPFWAAGKGRAQGQDSIINCALPPAAAVFTLMDCSCASAARS